MKSIIDIGMDVHKKTYSLCAVLKETGEVLSETRISADPDLVLKFIENAKNIINQPDADISRLRGRMSWLFFILAACGKR